MPRFIFELPGAVKADTAPHDHVAEQHIRANASCSSGSDKKTGTDGLGNLGHQDFHIRRSGRAACLIECFCHALHTSREVRHLLFRLTASLRKSSGITSVHVQIPQQDKILILKGETATHSVCVL